MRVQKISIGRWGTIFFFYNTPVKIQQHVHGKVWPKRWFLVKIVSTRFRYRVLLTIHYIANWDVGNFSWKARQYILRFAPDNSRIDTPPCKSSKTRTNKCPYVQEIRGLYMNCWKRNLLQTSYGDFISSP